ncbi:MAG: P-loop NTPase fold protein [bacterium]|nr:P-loop NTPase fold protein [bacterium]
MADMDVPVYFGPTRAILDRSGLSGVIFTELASRLLAETVRCLKYKNASINQLTSTSFVLTAFHFQRTAFEKSEEFEKLRSVLSSSGLTDADFEKMSAGFFSEPPFPARDEDEFEIKEGVTLGPGLRHVLRSWKSSSPLPADVLLLHLLDDKSTGISKRIGDITKARVADNITVLDGGFLDRNEAPERPAPTNRSTTSRIGDSRGNRESPQNRGATSPTPPQQPSKPVSSRRHARIVREATIEELGLNIADYAKALATILRVSDGEFSFALFGKWGSGKTTLLKLLKPLLQDPEAYRKAVAVALNENYADLRYRVVVHNAWKYRSPPESWIYLYRSMATAVAASAGPLERSAVALRVATDRYGYFSLVASLIVLAFALVPIQAKMQLIWLASSLIGVSTIVYLLAIWMGASNKVRQLFLRNLQLVGRDENLGMLALIGEDVRLLLRAWTKDRIATSFRFSLIASIILLVIVAAIWGIALHREASFDLWAILHWFGFTVEGTRTATRADTTHWLVMTIWTSFALAMLALPKIAGTRRPDKILLVVDDLDRCSPTEMLSVIENVRLLLDDEEINSRLQVLMLVDEGILNHAIELRYATMIENRAASVGGKQRADATADIVSEQIEKLFACHLRLSRLSEKDVVELVTKLAGIENESIRKKLEEAARARAELKARETTAREAQAKKAYDDVASGKSTLLIPENGPSRNQPPMSIRMRTAGDFVPMNPEEVRRARLRNDQIEFTNRKLGSLSEAQRLALHPEIVDDLIRAQAEAEASRKALGLFPPNPVGTAPRSTRPSFVTGDVRFSDAEIKMMCDFVPKYFRDLRRHPSPRSIKALLFKLQLARLLLQLRGPDVTDEEARLQLLLDAFRAEAKEPSRDDDGPYTLIARQVL